MIELILAHRRVRQEEAHLLQLAGDAALRELSRVRASIVTWTGFVRGSGYININNLST